MIWGDFTYFGKLQLCFVTTKMNSTMYTEMLSDVLISYFEENNEQELILQQDNASIHVSKESKPFFSSANIPLLNWPALSPDLNLTENLWEMLARSVYQNGKQYSCVAKLKMAIHQAWLDLDKTTLESDSIPSRVFEVILKNGGPTKY